MYSLVILEIFHPVSFLKMRFSSLSGGLSLLGATLLGTSLFGGLSCAAPAVPAAAAPRSNSPSLDFRAPELVPDDVLDLKKVYKWLKDESGIDPTDNFVFYASKDGGREMAEKFIAANPGKQHYWSIFNDKFKEAFGGPDVSDSEYAKSLSKAMAAFAKGKTWVFNLDKLEDTSYWHHEAPILHKSPFVTNIYLLNNDVTTTDEANIKEDLKAKPTEEMTSSEDEAEEALSEASEVEEGLDDEDENEDVQEDAEDDAEDLPDADDDDDDSDDEDFVPDSDSSDDSILPDAEEVADDIIDNVVPDVPMPDAPVQ